MVIVFPADVLERLGRIERQEGLPPLELVQQAVGIWSRLTASERRTLGLAAMRMVMMRGDGR